MAAAVTLFLFGGITALLSLQLPIGSLLGPGSGFFPLVLGLILMLLAGAHILQLHYSSSKPATGLEAHRAPAGSTRRVLRFVGAVAIATALLEPLGYPLVSFLLMLALLQGLGIRRWHVSGLIALLTAGASYLLFVQWLKIPLPKGWLGL
ncbi:MAG TPA: hypothetical protein DDZ42_20275 [Candidatus Rokubacteria bacterium]|nr:MAG: hypothetical protein A2050_00565 [Candidatus Rokubacteria bacterium GWA2_73_35]HBH04215.1 hypothetical protein [Candidatus Rokubacteria bacterium]